VLLREKSGSPPDSPKAVFTSSFIARPEKGAQVIIRAITGEAEETNERRRIASCDDNSATMNGVAATAACTTASDVGASSERSGSSSGNIDDEEASRSRRCCCCAVDEDVVQQQQQRPHPPRDPEEPQEEQSGQEQRLRRQQEERQLRLLRFSLQTIEASFGGSSNGGDDVVVVETGRPHEDTPAHSQSNNSQAAAAAKTTTTTAACPQHSQESDSVSPMNPKYTYKEHLFIVFIGTVLAFNSGFSNGVSLSGFLTPPSASIDRQSTSGYTGVWTKSALALADTGGTYSSGGAGLPNLEYFGFQISMILSFVAGSTISALLNPRPTPWRISPVYAPTLLLGGIFMSIAACWAALEDEGRPNYTGKNHFFFFVALANGVQNGISSMYSANLIRTTHLTGTTTDIGLFVGQLLRGNRKNLWKLRILVGLALAFWIGGLVSFFAVQSLRGFTLLINAGIFLLSFLVVVAFLVRNLHIPLRRALGGTWHWQRTMYRLSLRSKNCGAPKSEEKLAEIFRAFDVDGDGYIDSEDLYRGLKESGLKRISKRDAALMFAMCDRDKDGRMDAKDFRDVVHGENVVVG